MDRTFLILFIYRWRVNASFYETLGFKNIVSDLKVHVLLNFEQFWVYRHSFLLVVICVLFRIFLGPRTSVYILFVLQDLFIAVWYYAHNLLTLSGVVERVFSRLMMLFPGANPLGGTFPEHMPASLPAIEARWWCVQL